MPKSKCTIDIKQNNQYLKVSIKSPKIQAQIKQLTDKVYQYSDNGHYYTMIDEIQNKFMSKKGLFVTLTNKGKKTQMPNLLPLFLKNYNTCCLSVDINTLEQNDIKRYCALVETGIKGLVKVLNSDLFNETWLMKALIYYQSKGYLPTDYFKHDNSLKQKQTDYLNLKKQYGDIYNE